MHSEKGGILPEICMVEKEGFQHIERFTAVYRAMHVLLILSFFTLVTTGFPLKYYKAAWAKTLMGLWGGAPMAGLFHRGAALVLMALFAIVAWRCIRFLFPKGQGPKAGRSACSAPIPCSPGGRTGRT